MVSHSETEFYCWKIRDFLFQSNDEIVPLYFAHFHTISTCHKNGLREIISVDTQLMFVFCHDFFDSSYVVGSFAEVWLEMNNSLPNGLVVSAVTYLEGEKA